MEEREAIIEILEELAPGGDFENCTTLVDSRVLDSLITIPAVEVVVENFNSVDGLTAMVQRLAED